MNRLKCILLCFLSTSCALKVMTFNVYGEGSMVNDGIQKIVNQIRYVNPDIVSLQEIKREETFKIVLKSLGDGWSGAMNCKSWLGVITRHKIHQMFEQVNAGFNVRIQLRGSGKEISFWNLDLLDYPYAGYENLNSTTLEKILSGDKQKGGRIENIVELLKHPEFVQQIKNSDNTPVIVAGGFNTPSHLDWDESTKGIHHNWVVDFPVTKLLSSAAGMTDSFREVHPNPVTDPGFTWTVYKKYKSELRTKDRIDYIFYRGSLTPESSYTFAGTTPIVDDDTDAYKKNEWPSDHWALVTEFDGTPHKYEHRPSFNISSEYSTLTFKPVDKCPMKIFQ